VPLPGEVWSDTEGMQPYTPPRAMSLNEIAGVQQAFARAARNALAAGCDAILIPEDVEAVCRFLETIDFVTTPGYLKGPGAREEAGLPADTGPYRVVTNLATLDFHPESRRMRLLGLHPGVTEGEVMEATGFELERADRLEANPPPSPDELRVLREEVDRDRFYI
jgi:glutaconate CoA-transferase subunit B